MGRVVLRDGGGDMTEDIEGMGDLNKRMDALGDHRKMLEMVALKAVAYAKETVPRKTGNLGRTIRVGQVTSTDATILAGGQFGVGYAQVVEFGSRPHVIRPRNRKVLAWGGNRRLSGNLRSGAGATSFAMVVNHPGTQPKPFLRPAAERAVRESGIEGIIRVWNDAA
jgi:hypothetical protein